MLLRCDAIETDSGAIKIFDAPVFVTFNILPGYGWYYKANYFRKSFGFYSNSSKSHKNIYRH